MALKIGFAGTFYTLWDHKTETKYSVDSRGNAFPAGVSNWYTYYKNISTDLEKAMSLYPRLIVDESLRGKSGSFEREDKIEIPEHLFKFGKYKFDHIEDVLVSDFNYCLWYVEQTGNQFILESDIYKAYIAKENAKIEAKLNELVLLAGDKIEVTFTSNGKIGHDQETEEVYFYAEAEHKGFKINIIVDDAKHVDGRYPYYMPLIGNKFKRVRGKSFNVEISQIIDRSIQSVKIEWNEYESQLVHTLKVKF